VGRGRKREKAANTRASEFHGVVFLAVVMLVRLPPHFSRAPAVVCDAPRTDVP